MKHLRAIVAYSSLAILVIFITAFLSIAAISQVVGLAVSNAGKWKDLQDAATGDNLTVGILAAGLMLFDGTNFDRARGDATNGLDVDVTRLPPVSVTQKPTLFNINQTSAANTDNVVTITASGAETPHLYSVRHANCTNATSRIIVRDGATIIYQAADSVPPAPQAFNEVWEIPLTGTPGQAMTITILACGAGNTSTMNVQADRY